MVWALSEAMRRRDIQVQNFLCRACFPEDQPCTGVSGLRLRYLDSWLMEEAVCRELFVHGSQLADLSLVEGVFPAKGARQDEPGGQLETVCRWVGLPRIVLLDASKIAESLPCRPAQVDGVLLDAVVDQGHLARLATDIQTVWRVPVLGSLPVAAELRRKIERLVPGGNPPADLVRELGDLLGRSWRPEVIYRLAEAEAMGPVDGRLFGAEASSLRLTVAVAFDEAFDRYFPCQLDMLEARGAAVVAFSPLGDEHLPADCDIVLLGGGHPERHAARLADNHCMKTSLRNHVRWGRRIYGEGGGVAFLCQQMVAPDGQVARMAGLLPAVARRVQPVSEPAPVEATLQQPNWLGHAGERIRGYRDPCWTIEPSGQLAGLFSEAEHRLDMAGTFETIGSLLEVHFGTQCNLLNHFFYPHMAAPPDEDRWRHC